MPGVHLSESDIKVHITKCVIGEDYFGDSRCTAWLDGTPLISDTEP
jgi:hypothetical protein